MVPNKMFHFLSDLLWSLLPVSSIAPILRCLAQIYILVSEKIVLVAQRCFGLLVSGDLSVVNHIYWKHFNNGKTLIKEVVISEWNADI
jgi:hypothetical protein